ncbi:hypothetical protein C8R41DRAFT_837759 [Lentinula lateritia]|uniref:Uncharacterized protein n=1 Tax=Lentinula lateritia TaxID=40482 RepID=A0ABQ8VBS7_9AGAR|nr:hypothetical protein C8R41DRAFT_837759 [Lentinula lateritia]
MSLKSVMTILHVPLFAPLPTLCLHKFEPYLSLMLSLIMVDRAKTIILALCTHCHFLPGEFLTTARPSITAQNL